ncbi:hypothetical protein Pcinc_011777 [Petrolisthes cinctipes]|uniref:Uncharacterized protein n=1 Tax=Petrolisthes cinctipes TaxID=88211 RepID=A0AAE1F2W3_PETCI|nr:hypothetical protein Pcinc_028511 [Petrolisthes cinctipes]KAK3883922.1 hypothetical protein Pcinc_011777 [Petrolisthes cinctipes]
MAEGTPVPANNKRKRGGEEEQQSFKTVKCKLSSILLEGDTSMRASIDKRVEVVSKMAFRASIIMEMILESLLLSGEDDDRWPDFSKDNMYDQIFKRGSDGKRLTRPTRVVEELWNGGSTEMRVLRDNPAVPPGEMPKGIYNSVGERAHVTVNGKRLTRPTRVVEELWNGGSTEMDNPTIPPGEVDA